MNPNLAIMTKRYLQIKIIEELFNSNALSSDEVEEFIKFTLFIVFDEYKRDADSLKKFYSINLSNYLENKDLF